MMAEGQGFGKTCDTGKTTMAMAIFGKTQSATKGLEKLMAF